MGITAVLSMESDLASQTILNKSCLHQWYKGGAQSLLLSHRCLGAFLTPRCRCYALPSEFDSQGPPRHPKHTDCIIEMFDTRALWDAFGVIEDNLVSAQVTSPTLWCRLTLKR
jgi:hypothetical protein